jgi:hypothetical protein
MGCYPQAHLENVQSCYFMMSLWQRKRGRRRKGDKKWWGKVQERASMSVATERLWQSIYRSDGKY